MSAIFNPDGTINRVSTATETPAEKVGRLIKEALAAAREAGLVLEIRVRPAPEPKSP